MEAARIPLLPDAGALAERSYATGAAARNWASYGADVTVPADMPDWRRGLLCDPRTSGGLLVAARADQADDIVARCHAAGFQHAAVIGAMRAGAPRVTVA